MIARTLSMVASQADDPRLIAALEDYISAIESGAAPDREQFLEKHDDIRSELAACLDGLDFVHRVAPQFKDDDHRTTAPLPGPDALPLGDYRILREIGRGGMGVVYEAQQLSLNRRVALKVLPLAAVLDPRHLQRFKNEALAAAQLDHPHIVPVYGVGCDRGVHYYAMKFIPGSTLAHVIDQLRVGHGEQPASAFAPTDAPREGDAPAEPQGRRGVESDSARREPRPPTLPQEPADTARLAAFSTETAGDRKGFFRSVAVLGRDVARALDYAHERGIVHRDIKPSNLMLDESGAAWVTDFGLAHIEGDAALTMSGDLLGTLRYMSPEQFLAKRAVLDHRTDIYSLGVTLYELLTLQPAFPQTAREDLIRAISFEEPTPVRKLQRDIPDDLEVILLKATAKNPAARYDTAQDLADDLQRFLDNQPIRAKRPTIAQRAAKWSRRHPALLMSSVAVLLVATVSLVISSVLILHAKHEADANAQRARANLKTAREAVDSMLLRVSDRLKDQPQMEEVRTKLLEDAMTFYAAFLQQDSDDPELQFEAGMANAAYGNLQRDLGRNSEAAKTLRQAIRIFAALVDRSPENQQHRRQLANSHGNLALALSQTPGGLAPAESEFRTALALARELLAAEPERFAEYTANKLNNLGNCLQSQGRLDEAEALLREALDVIRRREPNSHAVGRTLYELAMLSYGQSKFDNAESYCREALAIETNPATRTLLANVLSSKPDPSGSHFGKSEAEKLYRENILAYEELASRHPDTPMHRANLSSAYVNLAIALKGATKLSEAEEAFLKSMVILEQLVAQYPNAPEYLARQANARANYASLLTDFNRFQEAAEAQRWVASAYERLAKQNSSVAEYPVSESYALWNLRFLLKQMHNEEEAASVLSRCAALAEQTRRAFPQSFAAKRACAVTHGFQGWHYYHRGEWEQAARTFEKMFEDPQFAAEQFPDEVPETLFAIAISCARSGVNSNAQKWYEMGLAELQRNPSKDDEDLCLNRYEAERLLRGTMESTLVADEPSVATGDDASLDDLAAQASAPAAPPVSDRRR